jgi:hypothetical protein
MHKANFDKKKVIFAPPPFFFGPIWAKRVHRSKLPGQMVQKNEKCILPFCLHFEAGKKKKKDLKKKKKTYRNAFETH